MTIRARSGDFLLTEKDPFIEEEFQATVVGSRRRGISRSCWVRPLAGTFAMSFFGPPPTETHNGLLRFSLLTMVSVTTFPRRGLGGAATAGLPT